MSSFRPFRWTYPQKTGSGFTIIPNRTMINNDIEQYFQQLASRLKSFDIIINHNLPFLLHGHSKEWIHKVHKLQLHVIHRYINSIEWFLKTITDSSNGSLNGRQKRDIQLELNAMINDLTQILEVLQTKARFINDLVAQNFGYYNASQYNFSVTDDIQILKRMLIRDPNIDRILCSNDLLNSNNPSQLKILLHELVEERKTNPNLRLVYADFSTSPFKLHDFIVLPFVPSSSSTNDDIMNVLLIGESGVGKSTFINGLANYFTFETIERAQANKSIVLISDEDSPNSCKSYVFNFGAQDRRRLRIIDTPDLGNTRDMQYILEYIYDLTHLNAICVLLKPNMTRMTDLVSTCLNQFFELLGSKFSRNVIFCFTNARPTLYTPGESAPLLKDIPFNKENTFCFDNESFRYLVALQNKIQFTAEQKREYETSWSKSVQESQRFLTYIRTQLSSYPLDDNLQSISHASMKINRMIRPMLEAIRNLLRNRILLTIDTSIKLIKLCPRAIQRQRAFCTSCERDAFHLGHFWILPDDAHAFRNQCLTCSCTPNQHISIDYILGYDTISASPNDQIPKIDNLLQELCSISIQFAGFLRKRTDDQFLLGLKQLIAEEQQICSVHHESNHYNLELVRELQILLMSYDEQMTKLQSTEQNRDLQFIYDQIQTVEQISIIQEQLAVIHQHACEEFEIQTNSIRRNVFSSSELK
ncbi:unnamed protein product [Adineta ricciae]|uniref:G domain-containing protein n=1 Tax=Adineta ricciae TaxID=249248 RepID=A0A813S8V1_ADIRI|nr:unnamed protein product [Adineta ricciae]CAF0792859.1 unnamed protein product [Adineta ricciae]